MRDIVVLADGRLALTTPDTDRPSPDDIVYAAPETLRGEACTERSDVYSAGVVVYRLLTGAFPVGREAAEQGRHVEARDARPDLRGSRVPLPLACIVERAIDPSPGARHATLEALCLDLEAAARELRGRERPLRRRLRQGAALLVLSVLAALVSVLSGLPAIDEPVLAVRFDYHGDSIEAREVADGMTIEMSRLLARADGLDVRTPVPSLSSRESPRDVLAFGRQRRASVVVSGILRGDPAGWRLVEAALVSIQDGKAIWAESVPVVGGDLFAAQEQIATAIVGVLQTRLDPARRRYSTSAPLQELFLRGRALQAAGAEARTRATEMFERIVHVDPDFVPASAALATTLGGVAPGTLHLPVLDAEMAAAARRAHAIDPHLAEANAAMGLLSAGLCRWSEGRAFFRASLEREPGVTSTPIDYALAILLAVGDTAEALDVLDDALEADPASVRVRRVLAHLLVEHRDYDRALVLSRALIAEVPGLAGMQQTLGRALSLSGRAPKPGEGVTETESEWGYRGYMLAVAGRGAEARRLAEAHPDEPARQTLIYAGLNDVNRTIDALQRTARLDPWRALTWMRRPEIEPVIRGDPRAEVLEDRLRRSQTCGDPGRGGESAVKRSEQRGARSF